MAKEKIQSKNHETPGLEMARRTLGRVKEMDLTPEEKEKVMAMIKEARQMEKSKNLNGALKIYNELLRILKENQLFKSETRLADYGDYKILLPQTKILAELEKIIAKEKSSAAVNVAPWEITQRILDEGLEVDEAGNIIRINLIDKNGNPYALLSQLPELKMEIAPGCDVLYPQFLALNEIFEKLGDISAKISKRFDQAQIWEIIKAGVEVDADGNVTRLKINFFALLDTDEEMELAVKEKLNIVPDLSPFSKLKSLDLYGNELDSLPDLNALTNLKRLDLGENKLTNLPDLSALINLKELSISRNPFEIAPDLSNLKNLEDLTCEFCGKMPDLRGLNKIQILWCDNNNLTELPDISHLTELNLLNCANNKLTILPDLNGYKYLTDLNCSGNQLTFLPELSQLSRLRNLDCDKNNLRSLPDLSALTNLVTLNCNDNKLEALPDLSNLTGLEAVICYNNNLSESEIKKIYQQVPSGCQVIDTEVHDDEDDEALI